MSPHNTTSEKLQEQNQVSNKNPHCHVTKSLASGRCRLSLLDLRRLPRLCHQAQRLIVCCFCLVDASSSCRTLLLGEVGGEREKAPFSPPCRNPVGLCRRPGTASEPKASVQYGKISTRAAGTKDGFGGAQEGEKEAENDQERGDTIQLASGQGCCRIAVGRNRSLWGCWRARGERLEWWLDASVCSSQIARTAPATGSVPKKEK